MALAYADRVQETTTTTGTGTVDLDGANASFQGFIQGVPTGSEVAYCIKDLVDWEVGKGIATDGTPDTLSRVVVEASSNAGALVNFAAGTKEVFLIYSATDIEELPNQFVEITGGTKNIDIASPTLGSNSANAALRIREHNRAGYQNGAIGESPKISFEWDGWNTAQIGFGDDGDLRTFNSDGTTYANWAVHDLIADRNISCVGDLDVGGNLFDFDIHQISSKDGGDFNIRVNNWHLAGDDYATETGFASTITFNQTTGLWEFNTTSASTTGGAVGTFQTAMSLSKDGDMALLGDVSSTYYGRTTWEGGYIAGGYISVGNAELKTNPIFCLSENHAPLEAALDNMYGLGYTRSDASFINATDLGNAPTSNSWGMYVAADGNARIWLEAATGNIYNLGSSYVGTDIYANGNVTSYFSDMRLKTKISGIESALDKIEKLDGFLYKHNVLAKEFGYTDDELHVGLSAQQVLEVQPEAVSPAPFDMMVNDDGSVGSKSGENYLTVDYSKLVPLLLEGIKELTQLNKDLKKQLGI